MILAAVLTVLAAAPELPDFPVLPEGEGLILAAPLARDSAGRQVALMLLLIPGEARTRGATLRAHLGQGRFVEQRFPPRLFRPLGFPGVPAVALAFRMEGGGWKLFEAKATTAEACDALGVSVLTAGRGLKN